MVPVSSVTRIPFGAGVKLAGVELADVELADFELGVVGPE
jgi:hypothetical protein